MTKMQEELNKLKHEYESLNEKLQELSEDELLQITGGRHNIRSPLTSNNEDDQMILKSARPNKEDELFIPPAVD